MSATRIDALDMTKGILVVVMVFYHSLNYSADYTLGFKYLPFLPPSFILIAGFLVGRLYVQPKLASERQNYSRIFLRGFRLLALFTLLNMTVQLVGSQKFQGDARGIGYFFDYWFEIYVLGNGRLAVFSILLPIAYLLILAPALILLARWSRWFMPILALGLTGLCVVLGQEDEAPANLVLLTAGLIGTALGRVSSEFLFGMGRYWFVAVAFYIGYVGLTFGVGQPEFGQLVNACLALGAIFSVCLALGDRAFINKRIIMLGRYSLVAYILQIAVLQGLVRLSGRLVPFSGEFFWEMLAVLLLLIVIVEGLEWGRRQSAWIDTSYRAIFA